MRNDTRAALRDFYVPSLGRLKRMIGAGGACAGGVQPLFQLEDIERWSASHARL